MPGHSIWLPMTNTVAINQRDGFDNFGTLGYYFESGSLQTSLPGGHIILFSPECQRNGVAALAYDNRKPLDAQSCHQASCNAFKASSIR
jgi:hypothetical protein